MTVIDTIYAEYRDAAAILGAANEISLQLMLESNLRKTLLLSAASFFEYTLSRVVTEFVGEVASGNPLIISLVQSKAIARQYHTWFDWDKNNANKFFSLFGQEFAEHMKNKISLDESLAESIRAFLEIGHERNLLVHSDYASYYMNKTPEEIFNLYKKAEVFVLRIGFDLRACPIKQT